MRAIDSRSATAELTGRAMLAPLNFLTDLPRKQLALLTQSASAMFRGSETMRQIQQQAAERATAHHDEAVERLRGPCDVNELLAIQADLLQFNVKEATQYWHQLTSAALKLQADMVSSASEALEAGGEPTLDSLQRAFAASLEGAEARAPH